MSLGVIVMRAQVDDLHEGHYDLIKDVIDRHDKTLIVIGLSVTKCTLNNPLDFDTRRRMILDHFPQVMVAYIEDQYSDNLWSKKLDTIVTGKNRNGSTEVILYGSRDSFIKYYTGEYQCCELQQRVFISGTEIRKKLALQSRNTKDFRAGAIWYAMNQYPSAIPTVDIAVIDEENDRILLGRKPNEDRFRLIGGFVQPGETYEDSAERELKEESGLTAENIRPVKSFFVDDWRYKSETNKITTFLYTVTEWSGTIMPDDDIEELAWFDINTDLIEQVNPTHKEMIDYLVTRYLRAKALDSLLDYDTEWKA